MVPVREDMVRTMHAERQHELARLAQRVEVRRARPRRSQGAASTAAAVIAARVVAALDRVRRIRPVPRPQVPLSPAQMEIERA